MKRIVMTLAAFAFAAPLYAQNIAVVNGEPITQKSYDQFIQLLVTQGAPDTPMLREQVKEEMINRVIMVQAADKAGVAKDPAVQTELELTRQGILVRALMAQYLEKNPITQERVQAEYNKIKAEASKDVEFLVRHILVEDEAKANDLIKQIKDKKATFAELAKQNSKDPGSAANGGELGWAQADNYVEPFAAAVKSTPKGQMAAKPVQSQFGWHVVEVVDERPVEFPSFEQVSSQLEEMMREEELTKFREKLRAEAKIEK